MSEHAPPAAAPVPAVLRPLGRLGAAAVLGVALALLTAALPRETRIILGLDLFLLAFVALTYVLMSAASAAQCAALAQRRARFENTGPIACIVTSLVGIAAVAVMLHSQKDHASWLRMLHFGGSLFALLFGWIAAQMVFAIQYLRLYYGESPDSAGARADRGLVFPGQSQPDLWDFMYYSFTIAMCYQTSDVSISGRRMRRLTLLHAIYSFFFVASIIGFVVNVLSNLA